MSDSESESFKNRGGQPKKRKSFSRDAAPTQQVLTLETVRVLMSTTEGIIQLIQTLKDNGCTMPDQKIAEILSFIMSYIDIVIRGSNIPQIPKKELCQVMDYHWPSSSEVRQRPGKGFKAVMRSLLRCLGCSDAILHAFGNSQRFYKHVGWNDEGRQKVNEAIAWRAGNLQPPGQGHDVRDLDDDGDDDEHKKMAKSSMVSPAVMAAVKASRQGGSRGRSLFQPKYDVLFSRTTWCYYLRIFMPMCDPNSLQQGIKLDLLRGQLSLKGRYTANPSLPPWCTQNETLSDLEVVQGLPLSACGEFAMDIALPFDVDRAARKEVHVTDIGVIVSLKRLKEEIPQMEFKVHTFAQPTGAPTHSVPMTSPMGLPVSMMGHGVMLPGVIVGIPPHSLPGMPSSAVRPPGSAQTGVSSSAPPMIHQTLSYS